MHNHPEVVNDIRTALTALGNDMLWTRNRQGQLYTVVPDKGLKYIRQLAHLHEDRIEFAPYPSDETAGNLLRKEESLSRMARYVRLTLKDGIQDFQPANMVPRPDDIKARHIALCNSEILINAIVPFRPALKEIKTSFAVAFENKESPFLEVTLPTLVARQVYHGFPKEVLQKDQGKGGAAWKVPELTLLSSNEARAIQHPLEAVPLRHKRVIDAGDHIDFSLPLEKLPEFLPGSAIRHLAERHHFTPPSQSRHSASEDAVTWRGQIDEPQRGPRNTYR